MGAKINLNTSADDKESTQAGKLVHGKLIERLVQKFRDYNADAFGKGLVRNLTTGKEMDYRMIKDLLIALVFGNEGYIQFVDDRLKR